MVTEVNGQSFENEVIKSGLPVVVDFWALQVMGCGPHPGDTDMGAAIGVS